MSRQLTLLALVAIPGLALSACDTPSTLSKAKPGECYSVVGKGSFGEPKLAKTPCAGSPAALAAACPKPDPATAQAGAGNVACPTTATKVAASGHKASSGRATVRKTAQRATVARHGRAASVSRHYASRDDRVAKSGEVTSLGIEYARVGEELAGGPGYHHGGGYERRESYERHDYAPPPPPPFVHRRKSGASIEYSERSRQSRSYSESYSSSSSRGGYGRIDCDCEGRGQPPHSPFDGYGYLTWRGKTPG